MFVLQKGCGYHLDLLIVAVMLGVCSIMGLPWFVAATVLSISHVNSLKVESGCSAPGEQPKFLGIREQRVTGFMIFVLMGCSVFMTSVLKVKRSKLHSTNTFCQEYYECFKFMCYFNVVQHIAFVFNSCVPFCFTSALHSLFQCLFCMESFSTWASLPSKAFK